MTAPRGKDNNSWEISCSCKSVRPRPSENPQEQQTKGQGNMETIWILPSKSRRVLKIRSRGKNPQVPQTTSEIPLKMANINSKNSGYPWGIWAVKREQLTQTKDPKGTSRAESLRLSNLDTAEKPAQSIIQVVGIHIVKLNNTNQFRSQQCWTHHIYYRMISRFTTNPKKGGTEKRNINNVDS